jgi:hypothetical protein
MKKCLQCEQIYGDETNFCLSDGAALVSVSGSFTAPGETPTVFSGSPAPTNFPAAPFIPPAASTAPRPAGKSNALLIIAGVGIFVLLAGGALIALVMYSLNSAGKPDANPAVSNANDEPNKNASSRQKSDGDEAAENLKKQPEKLDKDRRKLEEERRRLETQKTPPTPAPTVSGSVTTAVIIDPPSNIRATPNGAVICVARSRGTIVNILGSTGVADNNGTWYYTDYCGARGVIHSTQIRF